MEVQERVSVLDANAAQGAKIGFVDAEINAQKDGNVLHVTMKILSHYHVIDTCRTLPGKASRE